MQLLALAALALASLAAGLADHQLADPDQQPLGPQPLDDSQPLDSHPLDSQPLDPPRPNIILILTDDQDLHLDSLDYLPHVRRHLGAGGTQFGRHYCTTAVCCPSRVSLLTGRLAHNTNVTDVVPPHGGYPKFVAQGLNERYLPVWLQRQAGYATYYVGKLLNAHTTANYDRPRPGGWTQSDFLLDPDTYRYLNATFQRNGDAPVRHEGQYSVDVLAHKAYGFLEAAAADWKARRQPFFLGIAPVAPHSNVELRPATDDGRDDGRDDVLSAVFTPPVAAERHAHLFAGVRVPRTPHFNPAAPSGAGWVRRLARQTAASEARLDHFYRQRLRALQAVDELVDGVFARLAALGLDEDTYVFYTSDNGFHLGQHRLPPGKECGYEEDIHVPLLVRGPGVPRGRVVRRAVTAHVDLAPTLLRLAGVPPRPDFGFDGAPIPLTAAEMDAAEAAQRHEHVAVEFWGVAISEGDAGFGPGFGPGGDDRLAANNTYKAVRVVGADYSLYYAVWCSNEHELYDLETDPYQMNNLLGDAGDTPPDRLLGLPLAAVVARLDALLLVLKSCAGRACLRPWDQLHPGGGVRTLRDALAPVHDAFYSGQHLPRVAFARCEAGYLPDAEGPQFPRDVFRRHGAPWHEWV